MFGKENFNQGGSCHHVITRPAIVTRGYVSAASPEVARFFRTSLKFPSSSQVDDQAIEQFSYHSFTIQCLTEFLHSMTQHS
jgi:hypothetical protein